MRIVIAYPPIACSPLTSQKMSSSKLNPCKEIRRTSLNKSKLKNLKSESENLPGKNVFIDESLDSYSKKLCPKSKTWWGFGHVAGFYVSKRLLRIKLCNESVSIITHKCDLKKLFPDNPLIKITSYWLILISVFVVPVSVPVSYFHWTYHLKLVVFRHFENCTLYFLRHFCKFDQWIFSDNIYWSLLLEVILQNATTPTMLLIWEVLQPSWQIITNIP